MRGFGNGGRGTVTRLGTGTRIQVGEVSLRAFVIAPCSRQWHNGTESAHVAAHLIGAIQFVMFVDNINFP